ncbi:MAG: tyrosine-type recombinase/integrase [Ktedonobacteraceae bacterium]|nr:tyrosine-type recombinase/integrase [Ktedonobacteraceae bacterium]
MTGSFSIWPLPVSPLSFSYAPAGGGSPMCCISSWMRAWSKKATRSTGWQEIFRKLRVLGHKIPITQEIAAVIKTQITWVKQHYKPEENPTGWLFPASKTHGHGKSKRFKNGDPLGAHGVHRALNYIAVKYQIKDEQGQLFHFKSHAFRHTKAVELLNQGMSLVLVQQWLAHAVGKDGTAGDRPVQRREPRVCSW